MKKIFTLFALAVMAFAAQANVLTVCDGTATNNYAPIYGLYTDTENTMVQMIYPADMMTDMVNGKISQVKFFVANDGGISTELSGAVIQIAVKVVEQDAFASPVEPVAGTTVVGSTTIAGGETELVFNFNEPYEYTGGNLLIETLVTTAASFKTVSFYGIETEAVSSMYQYVWATWAGPSVQSNKFLPKAEFTFEAGQAPVDPSTKTDAPSSSKENYVYNDGNVYYNAYTVNLIETEPSEIWYRIGVMDADGEYVYGEWMLYTGELNFQEEGTYMIEAYAVAENKTESDHIWDGFTVSKMVDVEELMAGKTVANVRYFNLAGQEMQQANGLTIMVTTYTDGTQSAVKVVK